MARTSLGMKTAVQHADKIVSDGELTREQHIEVIEKFLQSSHKQDHLIALALLSVFIRRFPDDFDRDLTLENLIRYGNLMSKSHWKEFGKEILYLVMRERSAPAVWIDRISDEESEMLRRSYAVALKEMARRKSVPLERTLGILTYFLDEPARSVRDILVVAMKFVADRDPERLHYFLVAHEKGAGSYRTALISAVRESLESRKKT